MADQSVVLKIQKLLSLGKSNSNEAEAQLAMAKAQELLAKYNLDFAVIEDTKVDKRPTEKRERTTLDRSAKFRWQGELWLTIAQANFCWHWITHIRNDNCNRVKRHMLLGREANVVAVRLMGEYLEDAINRNCPYPPTVGMATVWRAACAERICERIREKAERLKEDTVVHTNTRAIALRDVVQAEYELNYDALHGSGSYRRKLIAEADWETRQEERRKKAEEDRIEAERKWLEYLQNETPEQKAVREKKEERERIKEERANERYWARYRPRYRAEREVSDMEVKARQEGRAAGDDINIDAQLKEATAPLGIE